MRFDEFLARWGDKASIVRTASGSTELFILDRPYFDQMAADFSSVDGEFKVRVAKKSLTTRLKVNSSKATHWTFDEDDILNATYIGGKPMEKFSWNPVTGEWLFIPPGQQHASVKGNAPFDDYVRGIVLHSQSKVTFRPFWPTWMRTSPYDTFNETANAVSYDAQGNCEDMLRAHTKGSWSFQYNINNRTLQDMTGIKRW